ncbi:MAG: hypothetical protein ACFHWZ_02965 [Phycisphaerales bacterium]
MRPDRAVDADQQFAQSLPANGIRARVLRDPVGVPQRAAQDIKVTRDCPRGELVQRTAGTGKPRRVEPTLARARFETLRVRP